MNKSIVAACCILFFVVQLTAQDKYELNTGWFCSPIAATKQAGTEISKPSFAVNGWLPATVPGTVLTTMLNNKQVPDPFYGMNNQYIPDIYQTGRDYYTYWFVNNFKEKVTSANEQVWLNFRGVNYGCDVFVNGHKVNEKMHKGMYLRQTYNITAYLSKDGNNRLAVIVYPPDVVGNPNGGQGGDGEIARNATNQYTAGWDWIQPIRDRNTGIWDKVTIKKTISVNLKNSNVVTLVPGVRLPGSSQQPAVIKVSSEIENPGSTLLAGTLQYTLDGNIIKKDITLQPKATAEFQLPDYTLKNPKLWWPNGYGDQPLYKIQVQFTSKSKALLDKEDISFGVREIQTGWNAHTGSRETTVNGQKIFIRGGNWIVSDAMMRFTKERYDAEIHFHRDMNLNLIRIWGGSLTERPEFYEACDKYGMLVFQDFWFSGDCNGRWLDPMKKEDQWTRRQYPDDHALVLESLADQIKMIRSHPSLAFYCGGNEITPPEDIFKALKDSILPKLDRIRYFYDYSNSDSMSANTLGGNGDGPYGVQNINTFWGFKTFPFNSEVGSVGVGDYESLERFLPKENMVAPQYPGKPDSVWDYHKYIGYDQFIAPYGAVKDVRDFGLKAQLVNYDQYRGLIEGFSAHMWDWYTGVIIWKTQNPWTALRGQMYDYYLDPNACLYGLKTAGEQVHVMYNPVTGMVMIENNGFKIVRDLMLEIKTYNMEGKGNLLTQVFAEAQPTSVKNYIPIKETIDGLRKEKGMFLSLRLLDKNQQIVSDNFYWLPNNEEKYSGLQQIKPAAATIDAKQQGADKIAVTISNPANGPVSFFNRISLVNPATKKRILPVFYSDNYISVLPGETKTITLEYTSSASNANPQVSLQGWNTAEQLVDVK
ncbi:MAG: glycoside hydrolase family 2 sugar binding [Ferruginibacter sp.]|uniref:glycoside hydrolase family 2 protein n=1 Tax=Ferruginibacter sp. TaxID=1940288 RepID=UPI002657CC00|nr:sugar-binding domain-containing protein [Ferruginibacter sp.]MDB5278309.1 glycoside hydrolase family 2 sugar binding [Ferruginibacter sp.]